MSTSTVDPSSPSGTPVVVGVGDEVAWHLARPQADLIFGRGPSRGSVDRAARMSAALAHLRPLVSSARWGDQVHGHLIASVAAEPGTSLRGGCSVGRCDGLVTADAAVGLVVWTADCVPVLIDAGAAVAAIHAGWRGIVAGIVQRAVRRLELEYGLPPSAQAAFLGPAVGPDHYQVGGEVVAALERSDIPRSSWCSAGDRVDLRGLVGAILAHAGLSTIVRVGDCTACDPGLASYRRDKENAGRQWSMIVLRAP